MGRNRVAERERAWYIHQEVANLPVIWRERAWYMHQEVANLPVIWSTQIHCYGEKQSGREGEGLVHTSRSS